MSKLEELLKWFNENERFIYSTPRATGGEVVLEVADKLAALSFEIKKDYPYYSERLLLLKNRLFMKYNFVDISIFGRISEILTFLADANSRQEQDVWACVHHVFREKVKEKFLQGHYADAVFSASKILMNRLSAIHRDMEPDGQDIDGANLIEKLFSEKNPKIKFNNLKTLTECNIQRGNSCLFKGWVYRIRNVNAHEVLDSISREEGLQNLILISKLMMELDECEAILHGSKSKNE